MLCMLRGRHPAARSRRWVRVVGRQITKRDCTCRPRPTSVRMSLRKPRGGSPQRFRTVCGSVGGMSEEVLIALACVNLIVVAALAMDRYRNNGLVDDRLNELSDAAGSVAQELLARTESLLDLKNYMPEISLINQNPMQGIIDLIKSLRGDMNTDENITNPQRSAEGRWIENGPRKEEDTTPGASPPQSD